MGASFMSGADADVEESSSASYGQERMAGITDGGTGAHTPSSPAFDLNPGHGNDYILVGELDVQQKTAKLWAFYTNTVIPGNLHERDAGRGLQQRRHGTGHHHRHPAVRRQQRHLRQGTRTTWSSTKCAWAARGTKCSTSPIRRCTTTRWTAAPTGSPTASWPSRTRTIRSRSPCSTARGSRKRNSTCCICRSRRHALRSDEPDRVLELHVLQRPPDLHQRGDRRLPTQEVALAVYTSRVWVTSVSDKEITTISLSEQGGADDLFFGEFGEGNNYDKYVELYNGTGAAIDLSQYFLASQTTIQTSTSRGSASSRCRTRPSGWSTARPSPSSTAARTGSSAS
jgi:hypothetical protein